jgi:hypothetical protein
MTTAGMYRFSPRDGVRIPPPSTGRPFLSLAIPMATLRKKVWNQLITAIQRFDEARWGLPRIMSGKKRASFV